MDLLRRVARSKLTHYLLVEPGTQSVALSTAQTRARYALAIWCLLHSPNSESYELWPFLADWEPRPFLEHGIERKRYEPETWTGGVSSLGRDITEWGPYELPDDQEILGAPFAALAAAPERASARAVVSGAWALHIAERQPNDLERPDELLFLTPPLKRCAT